MRHQTIERITSAVTVLLLVGGCGWALVTWGPSLACEKVDLFCPPPPGAQQLAPFIDDYLAAAGVEIDAEDYVGGVGYLTPPGNPYRIGRVAVVDVDERAIDPRLTRALPLDIVATLPEEVTTVIWLRWGETREGEYHANGYGPVTGRAYRGYCDLVVVDVAAGLIVGTREFLAVSPPGTTTASGDIHTEVDVGAVANWVKALPVHAAGASPVPSADSTPTDSPSPTPAAALQPGESFTLDGDVSELTILLPDERIDLLAGDYRVVFKGSADEACTVCVSVTLGGRVDSGEHFVFAITRAAEHVRVGRWSFTDQFTLTEADAGTYYFQIEAPVGSWSMKLIRDE